MKYSDIDLNAGFTRNMRQTPWTKLFPHWWTEDDLTRAIGEEIERIKAQMIFALLNMGIKPPVMIWQRSLNNKEYKKQHNITSFPNVIEIKAPKYKTWGNIVITNNGEDDIYDLKIMLDDINGMTITNTIAPNDVVVLDIESQRFSLNNHDIYPSLHGEGIPYFITSQYDDEDKKDTPLANEILRLTFDADNEFDVDLNIDITLNNAVFVNEQNIEITSLELLPIDKVDLYAKYEFPFRPKESGWKLVYTKDYQSETNVIYDMITTHFDTKEFYVEVFFRELEYPYKVGFPCYKDADEGSMYHVNNRLDAWGKMLSLPRREYKTFIDEMDYPFTFPIYYPFDIEQDFWYYSRLVNEYCLNEEAINEVDLLDTNGHGIMRLHSINPFVEDFAIHAKTIQPTERENINYNFYVPSVITQINQDVTIDNNNSTATQFIDVHPHRVSEHYQAQFIDIENLLDYNDNYSMITLYNKIGQYITYDLYKSQELDLFFDLSNLPEHINIEGFEFTIDAESTDNSLDKYNDIRTRVELRSFDEIIFAKSIGESGQYGLEREDIVYGGKNILFDFDEKIINKKIGDVHVLQEFIIKPFSGTLKEYVEIPFTLIENDKEINQLENVAIIYDNKRIVSADYITEKRSYVDTKTQKTITEDVKLLRAYIPDDIEGNTITIQSLKSDTHYPFNVTFDIQKDLEANTDESHDPIPYIEGPIVNNEIKTFTTIDEWDTGSLRDILQKSGLHFIYTLQNDNETNTPTFIIHNITLKVFYSPKKTQFDLQTYIDTKSSNETSIGTLIIDIKNTGSIPFDSKIDIFNEQNISLSTNSINVNLNPYDSAQYKVQIQQQPLLVNGVYDIITFCENIKRQNTIIIDTGGLIQTTTKVKPIFTQYHDNTTFEASVNTTDRNTINEGFIEFYVNKRLIGTVTVENGQGILTKSLVDFDIETGFYNLEARYTGSDKYAPSRASSIILISKQQTNIEITSPKYGNLNTPYMCEAIVKSNDELVTEGNVTFYLDDEELGRPDVDANGTASLTHIFDDKKPCSYTLKAIYNGTVTYGHSETIKDIILSGGETETIVYNVVGAPKEKITLSAKVIQKMCAQAKYNTVNQGKITIQIVDNDNVLYTNTLNVNNEGRISIPWTIPKTITVKDYQIVCSYTDESGVFSNSKNIGILSVQRKNVQLKHQSLFYGSRYEPLGFYVQIRDENNFAVTEGKISVTIPSLNITAIADVDSDSSAKIIYNAIDFTYQEWNELDHLSFKRGEGNVFYYDGVREVEVPENLYRIYDNDYRDLQYVDFDIRDGNLYYKRESQSDEQVYIGDDGYLYARTNIDDINMDLKQYVIGTHDIIFKYIPTEKYNNTTSNSKIKITTPQVDADLHSYNLKYNSNDLITCFITQYDWTNNKNELVNNGVAYFYIDNVFLSKVKTQQGKAILPTEILSSITANNHLLSVEYIPTNKKAHTFTYTLLSLEQIPSTIIYQKNRMLKGKDTYFEFTIKLPPEYQNKEQKSGYIYGNVDIFLNEEKISNYYLFGNENGVFTTVIKIPDDVEEKNYELFIKYEGTNFIKESSLSIPLQHTALPIHTDNISIQTAANEICNINIPIRATDNDDISEGCVVIYDDNKIIAKANVIHNHALVSFNIGNKTEGNYTYIIKYEDGENYINGDNNALLHVNVINPLNKIYVATYGKDDTNNGSYSAPFKTLERALNCLSNGGEIYIIDKVAITQSININKDVYINGDNESVITKDLKNLLQDDNIYNNLHIYSTSTLSDKLFEIDNLTINNLNTNEFSIIAKELYFLKNNELIPIYLYDNNKFYSNIPLSIQNVNSVYNITSNKKLHINNVTFNSSDNNKLNDFTLINYGELEIYHSVIQSNIAIHNYNTLTMNRNIIYGNIYEGKQYNLDNNWWGSNTVTHTTNNNIILQIKADIEPPVLGEDFHVIAEMIGENGRYYDIPQLNVLLKADTGYFQTPSGTFNNQQFNTLYVDAVQEGQIYATVDNETVSMNVYNYDRKTEIILDDAITIPIGYQIPIRAKIQSCADIFYQFDENNNIINQTNDINNGKVIFYLDDIQIGQGYVHNGIAEIPIYFSTNHYRTNKTYKISAEYIADKYYFNSYQEKNITLVTETNICFVSPDGDNDNDGTFLRPFQTITAGLLSQKNTIYLKDGHYIDTNIIINRDVNIKKYNNYAIFENNNDINVTIFNINENNEINVTLKGLDFINNKCNNIINNMNNLTITECLFYNNKLQGALIDNIHSKSLRIYRSSIVNNNMIVNDKNKINTLKYCWFGTNTPNDESANWFGINTDNDTSKYIINNYIIMDAVTSKDIIYIGTIARITARLKHYKNNNTTYILDDPLPLRIAIFESDSGLFMPLKDYTYYNQSTSLFNSNTISNSDKIFLSLPDNKNYINEPLILKCNVTNAIGNNMEEGHITFTVTTPQNKIYIFTAPINNGIAIVHNNYLKLNEGIYDLQCTYQYNQQTYSVSGQFNVQQPNIIIDNCQLHNVTLESMQIYAEDIHDSLNKKVYNQNIKIFIDGHDVYNMQSQNLFQIQDGIIDYIIDYKMLNSGKHTLTITTDKLMTEYETLTYNKEFIVDKYDTHIDFKYDKIPQNYEFDLSFNVLDSNNNFVLDGNIDIYFDDMHLELESNKITNGICTIPNFKITEKGQHSFYINYYGDNNHYYSSSYINNNINVDLYEVIIDSEELQKQLIIDSRSDLDLKFHITDILNNNIDDGYVNVYIDGLKLNDNPITFDNEKYIKTLLDLPPNTSVGRHDCTIEYIDDSNTYVDTTLNTYMYITQIPINILINDINTESSTNITIPYDIESPYGNVTTGILTAYINDSQIGVTTVTNNTIKNIELHIPKLPIGNYDIIFKYVDSMGNYQETESIKTINIIPKTVNIETSHQWYYPNKDFNFIVTIKDNDGNYIDNGNICIYIDSVKETENKPILYGECEFILNFNKVQNYELTVVYTDNEYYASNTYTQIFKVSAVPISNITVQKPLKSVANTEYNNTFVFDTFESQNVYDGIIDIFLANDKVGTFYINDINKDFKINIGNLDAGTYDFEIQYHDSELFDDYSKTFDFIIEERTLNIAINNNEMISAKLNEEIIIPVTLSESTKGIIKYYLGVNEDNMKFIGVTDINGTYTTYAYKLPKTIDEKPNDQPYYIIKAVFENNSKYKESIAYADLNIILTTPSLNITPITAYYNSNIDIVVTNNITGDALLEFYLNNEYIGAEVSHNKKCTFNYTLPKQYTAGEYNLKVKYNKSSIMNEKIVSTTLTIQPSPVNIQSTKIESYIGGSIYIHSIGIDAEERVVNEGTMSFSINDTPIIINEQEIFNINDVIQYELPLTITNNTQIKAIYHSANDNKYQDTISYIPLTVKKHNVNINIDNVTKYTRGDTTNIKIILSSDTIGNINTPINIQISSPIYTMDTITMEYNNQELSLSSTLSKFLGDYATYDLNIHVLGTNIIHETEQTFKLPIYNKSKIYVDANSNNINAIGSETDPVKTLTEAIDLISNNGNIIILSDHLVDNNIDIDKDININTTNTVTCIYVDEDTEEQFIPTFNISKKLSLSNFIFENYDDIIFNNSGELIIKDSEFKNNHNQCIINNNILNIDNTDFTNNISASPGTCISIQKNNQHTTITNCSFNENVASEKGSCIDSYKGNDVYIQGNYFGPNNSVSGDGTYISTYGNMSIVDNIFYQCDKSAIYVLGGDIQIELNIFHNDIENVINNNANGTVTANMNYWGANELSVIQNKCTGYIDIDTWLLANYELESSNINKSSYIIAYINQYASDQEAETYEFIFNNFIHHKVDTILYKNNEEISHQYIQEKINLNIQTNDNIVINIFGNNIEVE